MSLPENVDTMLRYRARDEAIRRLRTKLPAALADLAHDERMVVDARYEAFLKFFNEELAILTTRYKIEHGE